MYEFVAMTVGLTLLALAAEIGDLVQAKPAEPDEIQIIELD